MRVILFQFELKLYISQASIHRLGYFALNIHAGVLNGLSDAWIQQGLRQSQFNSSSYVDLSSPPISVKYYSLVSSSCTFEKNCCFAFSWTHRNMHALL